MPNGGGSGGHEGRRAGAPPGLDRDPRHWVPAPVDHTLAREKLTEKLQRREDARLQHKQESGKIVRQDAAFAEFRDAVKADILLAMHRDQLQRTGMFQPSTQVDGVLMLNQYLVGGRMQLSDIPKYNPNDVNLVHLARKANVTAEDMDAFFDHVWQKAVTYWREHDEIETVNLNDGEGPKAVIPATGPASVDCMTSGRMRCITESFQQADADEAMQKLVLEEEHFAAVRHGKTARRRAKKKAMRAAAASHGDEDPPADECVVCMESSPVCAFVPCGHLVACEACAKVISLQNGQCPKCRGALAPGSPFVRIYA